MTAIVHRPSYSLDTIATLCEGCEGYWPCDLAGHIGFYGYNALHDEDTWRCTGDCSHLSHDARNETP